MLAGRGSEDPGVLAEVEEPRARRVTSGRSARTPRPPKPGTSAREAAAQSRPRGTSPVGPPPRSRFAPAREGRATRWGRDAVGGARRDDAESRRGGRTKLERRGLWGLGAAALGVGLASRWPARDRERTRGQREESHGSGPPRARQPGRGQTRGPTRASLVCAARRVWLLLSTPGWTWEPGSSEDCVRPARGRAHPALASAQSGSLALT